MEHLKYDLILSTCEILFVLAECCFVKYATLEEADRAIGALHDRYTFPGVSSCSGSHNILAFFPQKGIMLCTL